MSYNQPLILEDEDDYDRKISFNFMEKGPDIQYNRIINSESSLVNSIA